MYIIGTDSMKCIKNNDYPTEIIINISITVKVVCNGQSRDIKNIIYVYIYRYVGIPICLLGHYYTFERSVSRSYRFHCIYFRVILYGDDDTNNKIIKIMNNIRTENDHVIQF